MNYKKTYLAVVYFPRWFAEVGTIRKIRKFKGLPGSRS